MIASALGAVISGICLLLVAAAKPQPSKFSWFEVKRRKGRQDLEAEKEYTRAVYYEVIIAFQTMLAALFLLAFAFFGYAAWGWLGVAAGFVAAMVYQWLAQATLFKAVAKKLYARFEKNLLAYWERHPHQVKFFQGKSALENRQPIASKEELAHELTRATTWLPAKTRQRALASVVFSEKTVNNIMEPVDSITFVNRNDLLGPLVLDDLHKTGHTLFPVAGDSLDDVIGILDIEAFLTIDTRRQSLTAEEAMQQPAVYVSDEARLDHALSTALEKKCFMLVVQDKANKTIGFLTMEDILAQLHI